MGGSSSSAEPPDYADVDAITDASPSHCPGQYGASKHFCSEFNFFLNFESF